MGVFIHKTNGEISNGQVLKKALMDLNDGRWYVEFSNRNKRTLPMNAYLHGVLIPEFRKALNSVGYAEVKNDHQAKLILKSMFLTDETFNKETGEVIEYVKDTHDLTTIEMSELFEDVIRFTAANMDYQIPFPGEQLKVSYE